MPLARRQIRNHLLDQSDEFRSLATKHSEFDSRLEELSSKHPPNERERLEQVELKKRKLWLKDRMAMMIRDYELEASTSAAS